jgi:hypothetical protein
MAEKITEFNHFVGFRFAMPFDGSLEIRSNKELDLLADPTKKNKGVLYAIFYGEQCLPWTCKTQLEAFAIAFGCQWGAFETMKKYRKQE